jgi:septal ring factor EnvC (AmiA/AmiB activator)
LTIQRPGKMKQYEDSVTAPKIVPNTKEKKEKDLAKQIRDLEDKIRNQEQQMHRMHRDIVRLRTAINEVSARIK